MCPLLVASSYLVLTSAIELDSTVERVLKLFIIFNGTYLTLL